MFVGFYSESYGPTRIVSPSLPFVINICIESSIPGTTCNTPMQRCTYPMPSIYMRRKASDPSGQLVNSFNLLHGGNPPFASLFLVQKQNAQNKPKIKQEGTKCPRQKGITPWLTEAKGGAHSFLAFPVRFRRPYRIHCRSRLLPRQCRQKRHVALLLRLPCYDQHRYYL